MASTRERVKKFIGADEIREKGLKILSPLSAELLGTALILILAVGSAYWFGDNPLHLSLAAGFTIAIIVECIAHVSGGNINPAISIGFLITGQLTFLKALLYIVAQILGGLIGAAIVTALTPTTFTGATLINSKISITQGIAIETIITFMLALSVFATTDPNRKDIKISPALVIGLSVAVGHLLAITSTGASMNPARSFGPAVIAQVWTDHWVYWLAPICGSVIAATMYRLVFAAPAVDKNVENRTANTNGTAESGF